MMQRYTYTPHPNFPVGMPLVELRLSYASHTVTTTALVDSGAALNILPLDIGVTLGLDWNKQTFVLDLGGRAIAYLKKAGLKPASDTEKPPQRLTHLAVETASHC